MRTNDANDETFKLLQHNPEFRQDFVLVEHYPFADIYEIKPQFIVDLHTNPVPGLND
jgi:hypothetical protein